MATVNLNSDLGESYGSYVMGNDSEVLRIVGAANVACGFHGGDPVVMSDTVRLCRELGVSVGAHPSYHDIQGFGRRRIPLSERELEGLIAYQLGALMGIAAMEGMRVTHVKPHGALNNVACEDDAVAATIARAVKAVDPSLIFLACTGTALVRQGREAGLPVAEEVFADRTYTDEGMLTPRSRPDAMIHEADAAAAHVRRMVAEQAVVSTSGKRIPVKVHSICVHGDGPNAVAVARAVRDGLAADGVRLVPLPDVPLD